MTVPPTVGNWADVEVDAPHGGYRAGMHLDSSAYLRANPGWHDEDAEAKAIAVAELIRFGGLAPEVVVDVGCGVGGVIRHLRDRLGPDLPRTHWEGWDPAPEAIRIARRHEGGDLHYVQGDVLQSERSADLLLCLDVVEHLPDDVAFLAALLGRARHFLFRFPLDLSVWDLLRPGSRLLRVGPRYGHRHLYTRELALQRLADAGHRVVTDRYHRIVHRWGPLDPARRIGFRLAPDLTARILGGYSLMVLTEKA